MTQEESQYIEALEALFGSLGWQVLTRDLTDFVTAIERSLISIAPDKLRYEQGRHEGLMQVLTYPSMIANYRTELEKPAVATQTEEEDFYSA